MTRVTQRWHGFTLVEIVVVLAILGITALAVTPALFRQAESDALTRSAGTIVRTLQSARQTALERGAAVTVIIDPTRSAYWVSIRATAGDSELVSGRLPLEPGVTLTASTPRARFLFHYSGAAEADSLVVRHQTDAMVVGADPWTGEPFAK